MDDAKLEEINEKLASPDRDGTLLSIFEVLERLEELAKENPALDVENAFNLVLQKQQRPDSNVDFEDTDTVQIESAQPESARRFRAVNKFLETYKLTESVEENVIVTVMELHVPKSEIYEPPSDTKKKSTKKSTLQTNEDSNTPSANLAKNGSVSLQLGRSHETSEGFSFTIFGIGGGKAVTVKTQGYTKYPDIHNCRKMCSEITFRKDKYKRKYGKPKIKEVWNALKVERKLYDEKLSAEEDRCREGEPFSASGTKL